MRWLARLLLVLLCTHLCNASLAQQTATPIEDAAPLDEVVVTGVRAGPRLWKVTHLGPDGEHELWILGVLDPLPKQLEWQSQEVSDVIATSQAVVLDGWTVSPDVGLFGKLGLYLQWRRMQKNPDQQTLREVLPADLYARFAVLQQHYAKSVDLERLRPVIAAGRLYQAAIEQMGLTAREAVSKTVARLARKQGLKPQTVRLKISEPRQLLESLNHIATAAEISCLAATLTHLESDLDKLRERTNAWALGDVSALRELLKDDNTSACWTLLTSVPRVEELTRQAERQWMLTAETSLQQNHRTLALRAIRDLLSSDGVLAQFRAKGYAVTGP
jgi:uncharacterized protein YbaP (TraB family)